MTPVSSDRTVRIGIVVVVLLLIVLWVLILSFLNVAVLKDVLRLTSTTARAHLYSTALILFAIQSVSMFLALPTKGFITLATGALLGFEAAVLITLIGALSGTSALFFTTRHFTADIQEELPGWFHSVEERITRHPIMTISALRLIIVLPYGAVTIACALSPVSYRQFLAGSVIGGLPIIFLYSLAGERLMTLTNSTQAIPTSTILILVSAGVTMLFGALFSKKSKRE